LHEGVEVGAVGNLVRDALRFVWPPRTEQGPHEPPPRWNRLGFAKDPEAARAWIEEIELPEAARKRALTPRRKPRQRDDAAAERINEPG